MPPIINSVKIYWNAKALDMNVCARLHVCGLFPENVFTKSVVQLP